MSNLSISNNLLQRLIEHYRELNYVSIDENLKFKGWVSNLYIKYIDGSIIRLDLKEESDLFLLFVLAISWSRTGPWENADYLVSHILYEDKGNPAFWKITDNCQNEMNNARFASSNIQKYVNGIEPRRKISFRRDIYRSIHVLSKHWEKIKFELEKAGDNCNYIGFMEYLRSIEGLGVGSKRIFIKIPLTIKRTSMSTYI
ncbi:MAG: hypothetical protein Q7I98_05525 [Erysipelotrichaceae bacterium]|nr:hypothetical protein [Erysipelotrichaceae bacterium]